MNLNKKSEIEIYMNIYKKYLTILLISVLPILSYADITGKVVGITDGDTITVLDSDKVQHKIRLTGIDAPEKKQAFGQKSKEALSDCAFAQDVEIQGAKLDRYGRILGKVVAHGQDCNLRQIELGLAWHYKKYEKTQPKNDRAAYADMELKAINGKFGLWSDENSIPPWEFRHK